MKPSDELFIKFMNLWFYKEAPEYTLSDNLKSFAAESIERFQYGDDAIFSHPKINEITILLKDYGIVDYHKPLMELYYEGRIRAQMKLRDIFADKHVSSELDALINVLGNTLQKFANAATKQIEKEKNLSAIPELLHKHIYQN